MSYHVDLTGSFAGMIPSKIPVLQSVYWSAVAFYKYAFSGIEEGEELRSAYGFTFTVETAWYAGANIRLHLPSASDREEVANKLANGGHIEREGGLIKVTDRYEINWSIA